MKKAILIASVLAVGLWAMSMKSGYCKLEQEATHQAAVPIVEALAAYAKEHGIPNLDSFEQIEGIPYELKPCSERHDLMECEVLKRGYYFQTEDGFFSIAMGGNPTQKDPIGFMLSITHNYTNCGYGIYKKGKIKSTYLQPTCSLIGNCAGWFRQ
jgi:hypothetical protein